MSPTSSVQDQVADPGRQSSLDEDSSDEEGERTAPLLGVPGSASQRLDQPLKMNLFLGTAPLAQIGVWGIVCLIWYNVIFRAEWILFSFHPVLKVLRREDGCVDCSC